MERNFTTRTTSALRRTLRQSDEVGVGCEEGEEEKKRGPEAVANFYYCRGGFLARRGGNFFWWELQGLVMDRALIDRSDGAPWAAQGRRLPSLSDD